MMHPPSPVRIVEVGPRDGLQNIRQPIPTTAKLELIRRLRETGLQTIELTSVVSPRVIPQLADCRQVLQNAAVRQLLDDRGLRLPVLVPNVKGLEIAQQHGVREVAVFVSATEGFSKANINCSVNVGIDRAKQVASMARASGIEVRGYVSCIFADPYDGPTSPSSVLHAVKALLDMGCYEVSLGDTLGVGVPENVRTLLEYLVSHGVPLDKLAGHFHDTYGGAVANVWAAYQLGLRVFDSSVGGLGGCPFAPGAKGNVATEDLVYMFQQSGVDTGVDLTKLAETGTWISKVLSKENSSRAGAALAAKHNLATRKQPKQARDRSTLPWALVRETEGLLLHRSGVNLKIILNRPRNGNALTESMILDLTTEISAAGRDPTISRIIICARGKFFCTGMDLAKGSTPVAQGSSARDAQFERLTTLFETIDQCPKVTIACINGPTFGGGAGLAFACDIRLAAQPATITLSEVKLGLCAATISKYIIREWGVAFARQAMLSARPVPVAELKALGVIADVAESPEKLEVRLEQWLGRLKMASPDASRMSKELVQLGWAHAGTDEQAQGIKGLFDAMMRPEADGSHGVKEFQAKRPVDWDAYALQRSQAKAKL
ncbi:aldolase [Aspergillus candidus]|uniref:hydroxymethylglutaryl-CoA lyase n=1 Tax=Aspergillus candidus TaxID=41067 RepID=A0A2I2F0U4_ASPCN|nr:aldolase [Aspergillus candidus]PLB34253.1 aldolase [Aspergillus candidus]